MSSGDIARWGLVLVAVLAAGPTDGGAETVVLPAVTRGVRGLNGSYWDSEVRIAGVDMEPPQTVRRLWVALPDGGFVDDPATAPSWTHPGISSPGTYVAGMVILTGEQLLQGTQAAKGAVALDIGGTGNQVFLRNSNTLGQPRLPLDGGPTTCCLPGSGQLVRGLRDPLLGGGFIPWATSGRTPFRMSVGVINPTGQARSFAIQLWVFTPMAPWVQPTPGPATYWGFENPVAPAPGSIQIGVPAWGFRQIDDFASVFVAQCQPNCDLLNRVAAGMIWVSDNNWQAQLPFYAYGSVVWTPLNDPEFIPAEPVVP